MPLTINYREIESKFEFPFRLIISGSSQSGKTSFAKKLLENNLFDGDIKKILYCYPEYLSETPVDWHEELSIPVTYQIGLPSLDDLCELEPDSAVVLDDLYEECIISKQIDYLFRVLSGKKRLSVMIMTQRFFAQGRFAMNIRNCCNYTVMMRNVDERLNSRVANLFKASSAINKIIETEFSKEGYPYIFVDSSPRGQITGYRLYTNIFGRFMEVYDRCGMKAYVIRESDFLKNFEILNNSTAQKHGFDSEKKLQEKPGERENSGSNSEEDFASKIRKRTHTLRRNRKIRKALQ